MQLSFLTVVVIAANVLGAAMAVPQARKLLRTRRTDGVSMSWAAVSAVVNAWWGVYGLGVADISIVPVSFVSVAAYLVIVAAVARHAHGSVRRQALRAGTASAAVAVVPVLALVAGGWPAAGIALGALYGIQLSPAVVSVYRTIDVSGVSVATWLIAFAEAVLWGVYGFVSIDAGLLALASTGLFMSTLVLVRLVMRRPRHRLVGAPLGGPAFATA